MALWSQTWWGCPARVQFQMYFCFVSFSERVPSLPVFFSCPYVSQYWVVKNQNVCLFIDRLDFETSKECVAQRSRGRFWQLLCCEIEQSPSPFCTWGRLWSELERLGFVTPLAIPNLLQFYNAMSQLCSDHRRIFLNCWIWKVSCRRR